MLKCVAVYCSVCLLAISSSGQLPPITAAQPLYEQSGVSSCFDTVFTFQTDFWVNLHLVLRAESRRRRLNAPQQMNSATLSREEAAAWSASLDAYDDIAQLNSLFDERLISLVNRVAQSPETRVLGPIKGEGSIVDALNRAAPVYRAHLWPEDRKQDLA